MNLIKREMKSNLKSLIIWCIAMAFLIYAGMVKYSSFAKTGDAVNQFMDSIPAGMKSVLGLGDGADLTSVAVFYCIFFTYFLLLAAVHSSMLGATLLSKEERDRTADFLYTKPVRRSHVISCKLIAAVINILIFDTVTYVISVASVEQYNTSGSLAFPILLIMVVLFILQLLFLGLGFLFSMVTKTSKKAASFATFFLLGTYVLKIIIDLNDKIKFLDFLSPFRYFDANTIMFDKQIDLPYALLTIAIALVSTIGTYALFQKRDLLN